MRSVSFIFLSVALLASARAQSPTRLEAPAAPPVTGGEITIDELQGMIISGTSVFSGHTRWSGDNIVRPMQMNKRWRLQILPGGSIRGTLDETGRIGNEPYTAHYANSSIINHTDMKPDVTGPRAVVWTFEGNTLTGLRVYERGASISKIVLSRIGSSLRCTQIGSFIKEVGAGNPTHKAYRLGGHRELIGMKQISFDVPH